MELKVGIASLDSTLGIDCDWFAAACRNLMALLAFYCRDDSHIWFFCRSRHCLWVDDFVHESVINVR